jgi:hypothetical protein
MDSYRSQYSFSPNGFNANNNVHSPRPGTYSPGPINYSPGFNSPEMPRPYTPAEGNGTQVKKPKTMAQWVAAAKESTHKIRRDGSLSPLVWVRSDKFNFVIRAYGIISRFWSREQISHQMPSSVVRIAVNLCILLEHFMR